LKRLLGAAIQKSEIIPRNTTVIGKMSTNS